MKSHRARHGIFWGAVLVAGMLSLAGCAEVRVVDSTPGAGLLAAPPGLPTVTADHNLAIVTVDFYPPLDAAYAARIRQSLTLLVAVENTGSATEKNLSVHARLSSPDDPQLLVEQGAGVASIAPGEIQVVRFPPLKDVPLYRNYRLELAVDSVEGERNLADNQKAFDIQIGPEK